ncbi:MAG: CpXC domain-containing protein [Elusimicrobiaceae bacterium]
MPSMKGTVIASCPAGCGDFETVVWTLIRADEDQDLKDTVLGGELNLAQCPVCSQLCYCKTSVIYLDPPHDVAVIVLPEGTEQETMSDKIKSEYETIKGGLARELKIETEPVIVFGTEPLRDIIQAEQFTGDESEIIGYAVREMDLEAVAVKPGRARAKGWPYVVPCEKGSVSVKGVLSAAEKVLAQYHSLSRLEKMSRDLAARPELLKEVL